MIAAVGRTLDKRSYGQRPVWSSGTEQRQRLDTHSEHTNKNSFFKNLIVKIEKCQEIVFLRDFFASLLLFYCLVRLPQSPDGVAGLLIH